MSDLEVRLVRDAWNLCSLAMGAQWYCWRRNFFAYNHLVWKRPLNHQPWCLQLDWVAQSPSQPDLAWPGTFQGWGFYHVSEQPILMFHHPSCKKFLPSIFLSSLKAAQLYLTFKICGDFTPLLGKPLPGSGEWFCCAEPGREVRDGLMPLLEFVAPWDTSCWLSHRPYR